VDLKVLTGRFAVCRLPPSTPIPKSLDESGFVSITRTDRELSLVCRESPELAGEVERGWICLEVQGPLEFTEVGVLQSLATPLAAAGISIFVVSTYETDYLLVKESLLAHAIESLEASGHRIT
jgi:hypothetical protein